MTRFRVSLAVLADNHCVFLMLLQTKSFFTPLPSWLFPISPAGVEPVFEPLFFCHHRSRRSGRSEGPEVAGMSFPSKLLPVAWLMWGSERRVRCGLFFDVFHFSRSLLFGQVLWKVPEVYKEIIYSDIFWLQWCTFMTCFAHIRNSFECASLFGLLVPGFSLNWLKQDKQLQ